MKVNFLGSPCSSKTTTASLVFSKLKDLGINSEFISEQARYYISTLRYNNKLLHTDPILLKDEDQYKIMDLQLNIEKIVEYSTGSIGYTICDSSSLNALFYMSEDFRSSLQVQSLVKDTITNTGLLFYCEPVTILSVLDDPNRIHSVEQSLAIDSQIFSTLSRFAPELVPHVRCLKGTAEERSSKVLETIFNL